MLLAPPATKSAPVVLTMATEMKHDLGVSYDNISKFLETYFGIYVNPSTIPQAEVQWFSLIWKMAAFELVTKDDIP